MPTYTTFRNVSFAGESLLSEQLESNLTAFFDWGFLCIGGFHNVQIPTSGIYGGNFHQLRLSDDRRYTAGKVWEGVRKNWAWESGVEYQTQPIQVSGVYVNGSFHSLSSTGTYAHHVDYPNGRIVFDSAIPTGSVVTCNYTYKYYSVMRGNEDSWAKIQFDSLRPDNSHFLQYGSGNWTETRENLLQLPVVVVDVLPRIDQHGYELGNGQKIISQEVAFHVITDNKDDRNFLHDVITEQWNHTLIAYDLNAINEDRQFALDINGSIASGAKTYPELVAQTGDGGYAWRTYYMDRAYSQEYNLTPSLHYVKVNATFVMVK